jgi:hypothetical protein
MAPIAFHNLGFQGATSCIGKQQKKDFFFEKKKQETFANGVQLEVQTGQSGAARNR